MKVLVSLSCTMCPELVIAAQKMTSLNENITVEVYDLNHFSEIKSFRPEHSEVSVLVIEYIK